MTARAPAWFETKYIDGAIHVLQTAGYRLKGMFATKTNQKGNDITWKVAGSGDATPLSDAIEDRPTLNADRTTITARMQDWEANEWIKTTDLTKMNENEIQVAQKSCAMAIGRRFDQIPLRVLDAAVAATTVSVVGNGTAQISPLDLLTAQANIQDTGVDGNLMLNVALTPRHLAQLLTYRELVNSDYITDTPLMKQIGARRWLGMNIIPLPSTYLNSPSANVRDGFMWVSDAVGFATNTDAEGRHDLSTRIDYVPTKKSYFAANTLSATAAVIQPGAIQALRFLDTPPATRPNP